MTERAVPPQFTTLVDADHAFNGLMFGDPACTVDFVRRMHQDYFAAISRLPRSSAFHEQIASRDSILVSRLLMLGMHPMTGEGLIDRQAYLDQVEDAVMRNDVAARCGRLEQTGLFSPLVSPPVLGSME